MTEKARKTFEESFDTGHECRLCPKTEIDPELPAAERRRMASAAYRAHMIRLSHRRKVMTRRIVEAGKELQALDAETPRADAV